MITVVIMGKTDKELLIIGGIVGGGLALYYLLDKNTFHIGSIPVSVFNTTALGSPDYYTNNTIPTFLSPEDTQGTMPNDMKSNVASFTTSSPVASYSSTHTLPTEYNTGVSDFVFGFDITKAINNTKNSLIPQAQSWVSAMQNSCYYSNDNTLYQQMQSLYNQLNTYANYQNGNPIAANIYSQIQADYNQIQSDYNNYSQIQPIISQAGSLVSQAKSWATAINSQTDTALYNAINSAYVDLQSNTTSCNLSQAQSDMQTIQSNYNQIQSDYKTYQTNQANQATCQSNISKAGQMVSQAKSWASTLNTSSDTNLYNQMNSYYVSMQQATCNTTTSASYLSAIQNDYNQIQQDYKNYQSIQSALTNAYGVYSSQLLTAVQLGGCCNWWTQGNAQGNWTVSSVSGDTIWINLEGLGGSVGITKENFLNALQNGTGMDLNTGCSWNQTSCPNVQGSTLQSNIFGYFNDNPSASIGTAYITGIKGQS